MTIFSFFKKFKNSKNNGEASKAPQQQKNGIYLWQETTSSLVAMNWNACPRSVSLARSFFRAR